MNDNAKIVEDILGDWDEWVNGESNVVEVQDEHVYIIGLDPGETTGVAILRIDPNDGKKLPEVVFLDQVPGGRYGFKTYFQPYYIGENTVLVSEKWKERNKKGANREPQYIEGLMHGLWDDDEINWQYPEIKSQVTDEWLIEQGVWTPGKRHQMDALIHAIAYLRNDGHEGTVGALAGEGEGTLADGGEPVQGDGEGDQDGAGHSLQALGQQYADEKGEQSGSGGQGEEGDADGYAKVEVKGKRAERDLDGAFFGFVSAEDNDGSESVILFDE